MRISSTNAIEGGRALYTIGRIEAASTWHPAHGSPLHKNWRELVLRELIRKAEDIDADAIIRVDYQNDGAIRIDETRVKLKRVVATGIAGSNGAKPRRMEMKYTETGSCVSV